MSRSSYPLGSGSNCSRRCIGIVYLGDIRSRGNCPSDIRSVGTCPRNVRAGGNCPRVIRRSCLRNLKSRSDFPRGIRGNSSHPACSELDV